MRLSVLDQSTVVSGRSPDASIRESLALARHCEALGYARYWCAEHHNSASIAGSAPEILIGRAWLAGSSPMLRVRIASMPVPVFPVQGRDLAQAGVQPGPEMGRMLRDLRAEWLRAGCLPDRAALLARVR